MDVLINLGKSVRGMVRAFGSGGGGNLETSMTNVFYRDALYSMLEFLIHDFVLKLYLEPEMDYSGSRV